MTSSNNLAAPFGKKKSAEFARIAADIFAPVYPVLAMDICSQTGIVSGTCVDIGAGPGHLGLALSEQNPALGVVLYDASADMVELARDNIRSHCLMGRVEARQGPAEQLPFEDGSVRLVVSRGSIFFWDDQVQGINEIYRVLEAGGCAYIGGGFGNAALKRQIDQEMQLLDADWENRRKKRLESQGENLFENVMNESVVSEYEIAKTEAGLWIRFEK